MIGVDSISRIPCLYQQGSLFPHPATNVIHTLSLHDALPISSSFFRLAKKLSIGALSQQFPRRLMLQRSEEHTSELQSQSNLVSRLLLVKKILPLALVVTSRRAVLKLSATASLFQKGELTLRH